MRATPPGRARSRVRSVPRRDDSLETSIDSRGDVLAGTDRTPRGFLIGGGRARSGVPAHLADRSAQFALEFEHAARLAVEGRGPGLHLIAHTDQLRRDAPPLPLGAD